MHIVAFREGSANHKQPISGPQYSFLCHIYGYQYIIHNIMLIWERRVSKIVLVQNVFDFRVAMKVS